MKPYFENLDNFLIYLIPIYILVEVFILILSSRCILKKDNLTTLLYMGIGIVLPILLLLDSIVDFVPFYPDSKTYTSIITGDFFPLPKHHLHPMSVTVGYRYLSAFLRYSAFQYPLLYIILAIPIGHIGFMLIWRAWITYSGEYSLKLQRLYVLITFLYPLSILYAITPLRESYFIFALGLFVLGLVKRSIKGLFPLLIGVGLIFILRKPYVVFICVILVIRLFYTYDWSVKKRFAIGGLMSSPLALIGIDVVSRKFINIGVSPQALSSFRTYQSNLWAYGGLVFPPVKWYTWSDVLLEYPLIILQFLLAPLPIIVDVNPLTQGLFFIDVLFILAILLILVCSWKALIKYSFWFIIPFIYIVMSAMFEFFLTGAVRHRYPAIVLLLPLATTLLSQRIRFRWGVKK